MKQIGVAVIGTGWCGGIRAETLAKHALVKSLHLAETRPERLAELKTKLNPASATADYRQLLGNREIEAVYISATPESTHYPMARDALAAGKHVFLEKPIAMTLAEADELIATAKSKNLKFTIGYSQRFNPKYAYVRKCIRDATIGKPVTALVSRHITRMLGTKISGRSKLSPAAMEATHDLDFVFWCLEPAKPVRVYSQQNFGAMRAMSGGDVPDQQWLMVTLDNGVSVVVGGGWSLPLGYPNFSSTWIEMIGTEPQGCGRQHGTEGHAAADVDHAGRVRRAHLRRPNGAGDGALPRGRGARPRGDGEARARAHGDGGLHRRRPLSRAQRGHRASAQAVAARRCVSLPKESASRSSARAASASSAARSPRAIRRSTGSASPISSPSARSSSRINARPTSSPRIFNNC
jgi:scyllo-inositol 2-dehydrogenase (NAD+)